MTAPGEPVELIDVRSGSYHDSVTLMQVSAALAGLDGVQAGQVAMGTELNLGLLIGMGFAVPAGTGPSDLVLAIRASDPAALESARTAAADLLGSHGGGGGGTGGAAGAGPSVRPRTTGSAARSVEATLALISVPGPHAFTEAMDALDAGLDVMVFSDNVPVEQEVRLKDAAARAGRLVMGPDCGTAVIRGVGLGFANVIRPGPIGLVAASGTGAQQLISLLDGAGAGVRHCLGVGGRDLSAEVGGRSTRQALALLDGDPGVELIVLVSKPPAAEVEAAIREFAAGLVTPVQFALLGPAAPDLTEAAASAVRAAGLPWTEPRSWPATQPAAEPAAAEPVRAERTGSRRWLRGGFAGGTLCDEAMLIATQRLGPIASNIPLPGAPRLSGLSADVTGHAMIDFGDDELTRGRPHPMIDGALRAGWLIDQAAQPDVGVLLLDVVLGHGAHPDPAAELAPAIGRAHEAAAAAGHGLDVVVSLCGTSGDPQGLDRQAQSLAAAGAWVYLSNAAATRRTLDLLGADHE